MKRPPQRITGNHCSRDGCGNDACIKVSALTADRKRVECEVCTECFGIAEKQMASRRRLLRAQGPKAVRQKNHLQNIGPAPWRSLPGRRARAVEKAKQEQEE